MNIFLFRTKVIQTRWTRRWTTENIKSPQTGWLHKKRYKLYTYTCIFSDKLVWLLIFNWTSFCLSQITTVFIDNITAEKTWQVTILRYILIWMCTYMQDMMIISISHNTNATSSTPGSFLQLQGAATIFRQLWNIQQATGAGLICGKNLVKIATYVSHMWTKGIHIIKPYGYKLWIYIIEWLPINQHTRLRGYHQSLLVIRLEWHSSNAGLEASLNSLNNINAYKRTSQQKIIYWISITVQCCYNAVNSQKTPHSSPIRMRYGVSFVDPASDWYHAPVPVIIYVISYNIGPQCIMLNSLSLALLVQ